jgi:hypothetical protein
LKVKKNHVTINRERIAAVRQWIADRKNQKKSSNLASKASVLACAHDHRS